MHKLPHRIRLRRLRPQRPRRREQPLRFQLLRRPALRAREVDRLPRKMLVRLGPMPKESPNAKIIGNHLTGR